MASQIKYTEDGLGIELSLSGSITGQDIIDALKQVYSDSRFVAARYLLADKTDCTEYEVSPDEVRQIAALDIVSSKVNPDLIEAHIAPSDIHFGTSRMWQAYVDQDRTTSHVFRDRKSALEWIHRNVIRDE